ncbi:hypothetical protein DUI87_31527 [Hirundo rustica rustica]|uniref:OCA domain-containing protein n=1 Tax=Hirundo rustica rustica TaxID=333673 RepID=A0A3M0IU88_HIRRU|nr:hypothetical protein DUI87_31527 [Hirundo rustica rustica]
MSESEVCGYSPGQGSPLPGETASPKSCFQQSPSLPDSGLTELSVASPRIYHPPPPCKPPGMPAPADSELSSDPPQKRYMGVRVKMPVRELLRKIRLSKGLDPAPSKHLTLKLGGFVSPGSLVSEDGNQGILRKNRFGNASVAEKRRAHPYTEKQLRQSKQSAGQTPKGLEDLDILVEVLQEDLNESQLREEPRHPAPDGFWQGFSTDPRRDLSALSFFQFQLHREENLLRNIPEEKLLAPDENGNRLLHKAVAQGRRALTFALAQRFASLNKIDEKDAEKRTALHLAAEKNQHLMVSDLISLGANVNEQDSSGKTPLHLCAENGYLRVLEVLKNCKNNGVCVEVDLPDHYALPGIDTRETQLQNDEECQSGIRCARGEQSLPVCPGGKGFLGVYNPDPQVIHHLITLDEASSLHKMSPPAAAAQDLPGPQECRDPQEQSLSPPNSTSQPKFSGILNPIACISGNVTLVFVISREHFPVYDV